MNGCHNRADYKPSYLAQDGYYDSEPGMPLARIPRMVEVPFRMSQDCEYTKSDLGRADAGCNGCKWSDEYRRKARELEEAANG